MTHVLSFRNRGEEPCPVEGNYYLIRLDGSVVEFRHEVFCSRWGAQSEGPQASCQPFGEVLDRTDLEGNYRA